MTRLGEAHLLAFCASQREAFEPLEWEHFDAVTKLELAATARYLAGVEWYGHQQELARVADRMTKLNFEQLTETVDFEPSRFKGLLQARLDPQSLSTQ
jgi:hypothetical protein